MTRLPRTRYDGRGLPLAEWDKCNVCGQRFPNWPQLRVHKRNHTSEEILRTKAPKPNGAGRKQKKSAG